MKKITTLFCLFILMTKGFAQEINIPQDIKLKSKDDFKKSEALLLKSIDWYLNTPLSQEPAKRKEISTFAIKWMTGSPLVSIELVPGIVPMDCAECLMAFLGGWTKYSLENNYSKDKIEGALAGLESTIVFYQKNKTELGKKSDIEKLIKQKEKGKLRKYVESKF
ncbi:MAG: hypothetical protein AAFU64_13280 [Bacteroidota bacterium]